VSVPATVPTGDPASTHLHRPHLFPPELVGPPLIQLQVPHSRICGQLDHEYRTDPARPHPMVQERHDEMLTDLHAHDYLDTEPGIIR
jgi:hypothetical protein